MTSAHHKNLAAFVLLGFLAACAGGGTVQTTHGGMVGPLPGERYDNQGSITNIRLAQGESAALVGLIIEENGGYSDTVWQGVDANLLRSVAHEPPVNFLKPIYHKMLITEADAPSGYGEEWFSKKIDWLLALNKTDDATKMLQLAARNHVLPRSDRQRFHQALWANGQYDAVCLELLAARDDSTIMLQQKFLCQALFKQPQAAATLETLKKRNADDTVFINFADALLANAALADIPPDYPNAVALMGVKAKRSGAGNNDAAWDIIKKSSADKNAEKNEIRKLRDVPAALERLNVAAAEKRFGEIMMLSSALLYNPKDKDGKTELMDPAILPVIQNAWRAVGLNNEADRLPRQIGS